MIADPPKKRRWIQVHLSTALLLMFGAGGFVWLNVRKMPTGQQNPEEVYDRGWPWVFQSHFIWLRPATPKDFAMGGSKLKQEPIDRGVRWDRWHLVFNILVALGILAVVGVGREWGVRRRARQPQEPQA